MWMKTYAPLRGNPNIMTYSDAYAMSIFCIFMHGGTFFDGYATNNQMNMYIKAGNVRLNAYCFRCKVA